MFRPDGRFWARRALVGAGLGALVAILEFTHYVPLVSGVEALGAKALGLLLVEWGTEFIVLSLAVGTAERLARPNEPSALRLGCAVLLGASAGALGAYAWLDFLLRDLLGAGLFIDLVGQPTDWAGRTLYHGWMMLFFGGLATAVESSQRGRRRMLQVLRTAELARAGAQQRLAQATLGSLRERVDPEFVFETLSRLERLYEVDPEAGDRLLDELIVFLRRALADIQAAEAGAGPAAPALPASSLHSA